MKMSVPCTFPRPRKLYSLSLCLRHLRSSFCVLPLPNRYVSVQSTYLDLSFLQGKFQSYSLPLDCVRCSLLFFRSLSHLEQLFVC